MFFGLLSFYGIGDLAQNAVNLKKD